ncbi:MAG TPA: ATP-binding cassette domain-containing protein [Puia sp.]|jgi:molybdate transport system ATP-binding protein|nr:ATP-binding cassette domain-containing protein [Puia sp.]
MSSSFLTLEGISVRIGDILLLDHLDWTIRRGEQWAITGASGSGKTLLAHVLLGRQFAAGRISGPPGQRIAIVEQQHRFRNNAGATQLYYQQRFNASDADQTITVAEELAEAGWTGHPFPDALHILPLLHKPLIQLSNGENKRVQLAIALLGEPELLILDQPFPGLDTEGRATLHMIIDGLAARGIQLLLITAPHELPTSVTHVAQLEKGRWVFRGPKSDFHPADLQTVTVKLDPEILSELRSAALREENPTPVQQENVSSLRNEDPGFSFAVRMVNATVRYGEKTILRNINWEVRKGQRWNLAGHNGAGKSTLLSLITADNPQAYANDIWLFDRRRGTGETIWEIKKKIGFVSPELHLYFDTSATVFEVVASGLFDTIGLFRMLSAKQEALVGHWLRLLSLHDLRTKRLAQLSAGQQRRVLLARALIKNPPLLILDEPCQGLDEEQTAWFRELIDALCRAFDTTLIYVSHYIRELPSCIDRFLLLENGEATESNGNEHSKRRQDQAGM